MRIAQVAPLIESVPPRTYGGTERIVHYLTEELHRLGHEVTLFASGDSTTASRHVVVVNEALRFSTVRRDAHFCYAKQLMRVAEMSEQFDIIHFHTDFSHFAVSRFLKTPHVTTLHGRLDLPDMDMMLDEFSEAPVVSISDSQRTPITAANWVGTVYNGSPLDHYTFHPEGGDYLAFLGRFSAEKGADRAIEIALALEMPLKMAAKIDVTDIDYFKKHIEPHLDHPLIEYIGEVDESGKNELLGNARATLFPIQWPEPFGLVMTESMACGTPVIAFRRGSVSEVMKEGVSGFVVDTLEEAMQAVARIDQIDRRACRLYFQERFTIEKMALGYTEVYEKLVGPTRPLPASCHPSKFPACIAPQSLQSNPHRSL